MLSLGIDPGLARVGFGLVDVSHGKASVVDVGVITTPAGLPDSERLLMIATDLEEIIRQYQPDRAGVEQLFFETNVTTAMRVSEARGVIMVTLARFGLQVVELTPLQVKQAVTGDGKADKRQIQDMLRLTLGSDLPPTFDDAADALGIALAAAYMREVS